MSAAMPWIRIDTDIRGNRKTRELADHLEREDIWKNLVALMLYCGDQCPDGRIDSANPVRTIEREADWKGPKGAFVEACLRPDIAFLVRDGDALVVKGWAKRNGKAFEKMESDRARLRKGKPDKSPTAKDTRGNLAGASREPRGNLPNPPENNPVNGNEYVDDHVNDYEEPQEPSAAVASATAQPKLKLESSNPTPEPDEPKPKHSRDRKPPEPDRVPLTNEMRDDVLGHIRRALGAPNAQFTLAGAGGGIKGLRALVQLHSLDEIKATVTRNASDAFNRTNRSADWFVSVEAFDKGTRAATGPPRAGATAITTAPDQKARIDAMRNMPDEPEVRLGT